MYIFIYVYCAQDYQVTWNLPLLKLICFSFAEFSFGFQWNFVHKWTNNLRTP